MVEVVNVKFKNKGKAYYFDPKGLQIRAGDAIIVETAKGMEYASCTRGNHQVEDNEVVQPLRPVVRLATEMDSKRNEENRKQEKQAFQICQQKILQRELDMKLVDVEYNFERSKLLFFFTSEGRVDFRELVKDLATVFKTRIELRQIGVRDEARMLGGFGICGRPFCCSQFLEEFHPVSIKMAKTQGLSLNPAKISGACGRLMCCLKHEQEAYEDIVKTAPKNDAFVRTPEGYGSIDGLNLLRGTARVRLETGSELTYKQFTFDELEVLGGKGKLAEYLAAKAEGRLAEAGFPPVEVKPRKLEQAPPAEEFDRSWLTLGQPEEQKEERPQKSSRNRKNHRRGKSGENRGGENAQSKAENRDGQQKPRDPNKNRSGRGKTQGGGQGNAGGRDNAPRSSGPESGNVAAQDPVKKKSSGHKNRHRRKPGGGQAKPEKAE
ncbi:MAG: stage 0 sporulation family protein [Oscillospiraceae bacterium]|nr:stage 0 sporulation family protein [Oscillospiraceae bacterium]